MNTTRTANDALQMIRANRRASWVFDAIADGTPRVFYECDQPFGWSLIARLGVAVRVEGTDRAEFTEFGRKCLSIHRGEAGTGHMDPSIIANKKIEIEYNRNPWK